MDTIKAKANFHKLVTQWTLPFLIVLSLLISMTGIILPTSVSAYHEGEQTASYLSPDTDLYLTVNTDPSEDQLSKFWSLVNGWWQDPNIQSKFDELMADFETESGFNIQDDVLSWLGPEIAIGVCNPATESGPLNEVVIFVGTMNKEASDTFFNDKFLDYITDETGIPGNYNGIETLYVPGDSLYFAFTADYIIFSFNQTFLEERLDMVLNPALPSLADEASFQEAQSALCTDRVGMLYCNLEHLWDNYTFLMATQISSQADAARQSEKWSVQYAVDALMWENDLASIPNPHNYAGGIAYNDMTAFPDSTSVAGSADKLNAPYWYGGGDPYTAGDKDGYLLKGHDIIADGSDIDTEDYIYHSTTDYYYTCEANGIVRQFNGADIATAEEDSLGAEDQAALLVQQQAIQDMIDAFSDLIPPYTAATLYFTDNGVSSTVYTPQLAGMPLSAEPDLLRSAQLVPGDAVFYTSAQDILDVYWQVYKPFLETGWSQTISMIEAELSDMTFEDAIDYLVDELGVDPDDLWADITPHLDALKDLSFDDALDYLAGEMGYDLDDFWDGIKLHLASLSGTDFAAALDYLTNQIGMDLDAMFWDDVTPHLTALSGTTFQQAVEYYATQIGEDLPTLWTEIKPHLATLSGMTVNEAIIYLNTELDLELDTTWQDEYEILAHASGMTFDEAIVCYASEFGIDLNDLWAGVVPHLTALSAKTTYNEALDYLATELELNDGGLTLGGWWTNDVEPHITMLSTMTFEEAVVYLTGEMGMDLDAFWAGIETHITAIKDMTFDAALDYLQVELDLDLDTFWTNDVVPHLTALYTKTFDQAVDYINTTWGIDTAWSNIVSTIIQEAQDEFDEAIADLDQAIAETNGECAVALLSIPTTFEMPDILLMYEVTDTVTMQQNLDEFADILEPWLLQTSQTSINGVPATLFTNGYIEDIFGTPGYFFRDIDTAHYLVIGSTEDALAAAVGASQGTVVSLDEEDEYQGVMSLLPESMITLGYFNIAEILDTVIPMIPTEGMTEEEIADFDLFVGWLPSTFTLAYSATIVNTESVTMSGAFYLLPPSLVEQPIDEGVTETVEIPEQDFDFSQDDPLVGSCAVSIEVEIIDSPAGANIEVTAMKELPDEVSSGFELVATDSGVSILDIAYGIKVDKTNLGNDNVGTATITMKVGRDWADAYGIENIKIFRMSDGVQEVLPTEFTGYDGDYAVFVGTSVNGLSTFGLAAVDLLDTAFTMADLTVSPGEVKVGENVTISINVTNGSIVGGTHTVSLKINGEEVETTQVTLAAGASEMVSFSVSKEEAGTYSIEVGELSGEFIVVEDSGEDDGGFPIYWLLIAILGGMVIALFAIIPLIVRSRRA